MVFVRPEKVKGKRGRPKKMPSLTRNEKNEPTRKKKGKTRKGVFFWLFFYIRDVFIFFSLPSRLFVNIDQFFMYLE